MIRIVLICLLLAGCANQPPAVTFASIQAENKALSVQMPAHIVKDIEADCENGICEISEATLTALTGIITDLQTEVDMRIRAYNELLINGMSSCQYSNEKLKESLVLMESASMRSDITGTVKQIALALTCGALLWAK